jgi:hypothetical protein
MSSLKIYEMMMEEISFLFSNLFFFVVVVACGRLEEYLNHVFTKLCYFLV